MDFTPQETFFPNKKDGRFFWSFQADCNGTSLGRPHETPLNIFGKAPSFRRAIRF